MPTTNQQLDEQDVQSIRRFVESIWSSESRELSSSQHLSSQSERINYEESDFNAQRSSKDGDDVEEEEKDNGRRYPGWQRTVPIMFAFYIALIIVALVRS